MIVDVVHCCRCNRDGVLGLVFDVPGTLKAAEVCADCLRRCVEPWLKPVDLPEGKPVYADFDLKPKPADPVELARKQELFDHILAGGSLVEHDHVAKLVSCSPCPRCVSTSHYDPEGCPGKQK